MDLLNLGLPPFIKYCIIGEILQSGKGCENMPKIVKRCSFNEFYNFIFMYDKIENIFSSSTFANT